MLIYPKAYFKSVDKITIEFLKENEIKALILDVDNTLIDYYKNMSDTTKNWAKSLKEKGIKLYILSNTNHKEKVEKVANELGIPYELFAKKPFKSGFLRVQKELKEESKNIGVVGDQIFTDIIGGNKCKMYTILVDPVTPKDYWYTAWKRPIENIIKNIYLKKLSKEK